MSWKKYFNTPQKSPLGNPGRSTGHGATSSKFSNYLGEVYTGTPNRTDRYQQYDQMDMDSEVNAALDTIAEFCTQFDPKTHVPFDAHFNDTPTDSEVKVIKKALQQWCRTNDWDKRLFRLVRSVLKYGDQFFIRDPETFEWIWVDPSSLTKVIINQTRGKRPEQYIVRNLNLDMIDKTATAPLKHDTQYMSMSSASRLGSLPAGVLQQYGAGGSNSPKDEMAVDSEHIIHLSMTEGMDMNWPFGTSLLDGIFKIFKQKELLEDAILIYRIQRAPERRIFYIDTGNMPAHMAMAFVERVKNEIHQRRIPSRSGGGQTVMDSSYNPLSIMEDYFFATTADGRGSKVETLPGGENLGQIDDLKFFTNKMMRALRIPSSYLPTGPDDGTSAYQDGKVGTAFIQEFRFNKYCQRLQGLMAPHFDQEFKLYLKFKGIEIDASTFDLRFLAPQNFAAYREIDLNASRAQVFTQLAEVPFLSRRFVLSKYLGLEEDEIVENEALWLEENPGSKESAGSGANVGQAGGQGGGINASDLGAVGVTAPPEGDVEIPNGGGPDAGAAPGPEGAPQ
jgi:hypothetical protein